MINNLISLKHKTIYEKLVNDIKSDFGDNFYIELNRHKANQIEDILVNKYGEL